jgi:hypothetical protein
MGHRMEHYIVVRGRPRVIDRLRAEASRVARAKEVDWWVEKEDVGSRFCFGSEEALSEFTSALDAIVRSAGTPARIHGRDQA